MSARRLGRVGDLVAPLRMCAGGCAERKADAGQFLGDVLEAARDVEVRGGDGAADELRGAALLHEAAGSAGPDGRQAPLKLGREEQVGELGLPSTSRRTRAPTRGVPGRARAPRSGPGVVAAPARPLPTLRTASTTPAPAPAKAWAAARPMPLLAPVTIAVRPVLSRSTAVLKVGIIERAPHADTGAVVLCRHRPRRCPGERHRLSLVLTPLGRVSRRGGTSALRTSRAGGAASRGWCGLPGRR
jgi:hypothetical protein